jgi:hypothetical protein
MTRHGDRSTERSASGLAIPMHWPSGTVRATSDHASPQLKTGCAAVDLNPDPQIRASSGLVQLCCHASPRGWF